MTKPKILVLGYARHGKDTVAEMLRDKHGFKFISSSLFAAGHVVMPALKEHGVTYESVDDCFNDRHSYNEIVGDMRTFWYETIKAYNSPDKSRLSHEILRDNDMYVGMRDAEEFASSRDLYDYVLWVDASARGLPPEQESSMDIRPDEFMHVIANSGTLEDLERQVDEFAAGILGSNYVKTTAGIRLLSGAMFDYFRPQLSNVTIEDIASSLSKVCRFSGHIHWFYSVAQHLVNTSYIVPEEHAFSALCHDTAEAFTNDIPTPLKVQVPMFKEVEVLIEEAMSKRFGFQYPYADEVKYADLQMLAAEKEVIKKDHSSWAMLESVEYGSIMSKIDLNKWEPEMAEERFLERFFELKAQQAEKQAA